MWESHFSVPPSSYLIPEAVLEQIKLIDQVARLSIQFIVIFLSFYTEIWKATQCAVDILKTANNGRNYYELGRIGKSSDYDMTSEWLTF